VSRRVQIYLGRGAWISDDLSGQSTREILTWIQYIGEFSLIGTHAGQGKYQITGMSCMEQFLFTAALCMAKFYCDTMRGRVHRFTGNLYTMHRRVHIYLGIIKFAHGFPICSILDFIVHICIDRCWYDTARFKCSNDNLRHRCYRFCEHCSWIF
jgi:hypothetical protein